MRAPHHADQPSVGVDAESHRPGADKRNRSPCRFQVAASPSAATRSSSACALPVDRRDPASARRQNHGVARDRKLAFRPCTTVRASPRRCRRSPASASASIRAEARHPAHLEAERKSFLGAEPGRRKAMPPPGSARPRPALKILLLKACSLAHYPGRSRRAVLMGKRDIDQIGRQQK